MSDPNAPQDPAGSPQQPPAPQPAAPQPAAPQQPAPPQYGAPQQPAAPQYGAPQAPQYGQPYAAPVQKSPILSILSLIGGIVGIIGSFFYFGGLFAIAAVILGFIGRSREPQAKGFWLTGIILGFVAIALEIIVIIVLVAILASVGSSLNNY
ncbi:hypothetical protein GCM10027414_31190 [Humibacter ginsengiterrae]